VNKRTTECEQQRSPDHQPTHIEFIMDPLDNTEQKIQNSIDIPGGEQQAEIHTDTETIHRDVHNKEFEETMKNCDDQTAQLGDPTSMSSASGETIQNSCNSLIPGHVNNDGKFWRLPCVRVNHLLTLEWCLNWASGLLRSMQLWTISLI
jgi:hypothetical protein